MKNYEHHLLLRFMLCYVKVSLIVLLISSCVATPADDERLEFALKFAQHNRTELEKVLEYYQDDTLKYQSARFLIENMPLYFGYRGIELNALKNDLISIESDGAAPEEMKKKWKHFNLDKLEKVYDSHIITSEYLIRNIEQAFSAWQQRSWNKHLSFEEFCELILPYRLGDEPLEDWRENYREEFSFLLDSLYAGTDIIEAANVIGNYLKDRGFAYNWDLHPPHLGASFLLQHRVGTCQDACDLAMYVMRAVGIPIALDYYAYSSETRKGHTWNVIRDTTGLYVGFWFTDNNAERGKLYSDGRKAGRIFRRTFERLDKENAEFYFDENIPPFFKNLYQKDVSAEYYKDTVLYDFPDVKDKYAYLGNFHPDGYWVGLAKAAIENGKAVFPHMEANVIYAPLLYRNGQYEVVSYPFLFDGQEILPYTPNLTERETHTLLRKHTLFQWIKQHLNLVVGGRIEFSNNKTFRNPGYVYHIVDTPSVNYSFVDLPTPAKYRYARYVPHKEKKPEIAEFQFFHKGKKIEPVHVEGEAPENASYRIEYAFDNNLVTLFSTAELGSPIMADFGEDVLIDRFMYMPRNDDNFISIGDIYELFYHGGKEGWISLGSQTATKPELVYDNMPKGALFHLRNRTKGVEEQVFHMQDGKQIFITNQGAD